jgi:hypothetical protein
VPSILRQSSPNSTRKTRLSRKKAELLEKYDEDAFRHSQAVGPSPASYSLSHSRNGSVDVRLPKPSMSFEQEYDRTCTDESMDYDELSARKESSTYSDRRNGYSSSSKNNLHSEEHQHSGYSSAEGSNKEEIQGVIASLEEEFNELNAQYRRLLNSVQTPQGADVSMAKSTSGSGYDSSHVSDRIAKQENIQAQAEEIVHVIQQLHKKGEQLRALKSPTK